MLVIGVYKISNKILLKYCNLKVRRVKVRRRHNTVGRNTFKDPINYRVPTYSTPQSLTLQTVYELVLVVGTRQTTLKLKHR